MSTPIHHSRASQHTRSIGALAILAYSAVLLHDILPGAHEDHDHEFTHGETMAMGAEMAPAPVCPHHLPKLDLDAHVDCALCKLTRTEVEFPSAHDTYIAPAANAFIRVGKRYIPSSLDDWQPASRRGPPAIS